VERTGMDVDALRARAWMLGAGGDPEAAERPFYIKRRQADGTLWPISAECVASSYTPQELNAWAAAETRLPRLHSRRRRYVEAAI